MCYCGDNVQAILISEDKEQNSDPFCVNNQNSKGHVRGGLEIYVLLNVTFFLDGNLSNLTVVILGAKNCEKTGGKGFTFHYIFLYSLYFFSDLYIFLKYYLWAMALWSILFYALHVSVLLIFLLVCG